MTVRELALLLLNDYENSGKYVNLSLSSHLADKLTLQDRSFLTALLYTTVERKLTYDYYVSSISKRSTDKIDLNTLNILRLGFCQILEFKSIPRFASVNETVKLARNKGERAFVNGILRSALRLMDNNGLPMPERSKNEARYLSVAYSFPLWIVKHFVSLYGEGETEKLLAYFNSEQPTDITVNTLKISRDGLLKILRDAGTPAEESLLSELSIKISHSVNPKSLPGFEEGYFFVQDESSAVSAQALGTMPSDSVIDVCACPGGKSFAAAIMSGDKGRVVSLDLHESKLSLITDTAKRLGLTTLISGVNDATVAREELFDSFDRVICDVPCSGLGVLGKKPDMRYKDKQSLDELPALQYSILEASSKYLKTGGYMVYSTCTLNPREGEDVVNKFLSEHPEFCSVDFTVGELKSECGMLTLLPTVHNTDGFFIAKLTK